MSQVLTGVRAKLDNLYPGQIGANRRWSESYIESLIMAADKAVRERCETLLISQVIPLVADQAYYDLDSDFISIVSVEYSSDGTNYDDELNPVTYEDLDLRTQRWRDDTGTWPFEYTLLSAPGMPAAVPSQIMIYRTMSAVSSQQIRVNGYGIGTTTTDQPDDVQYACHLPFVMGLLSVPGDVKAAVGMYQKFLSGCDSLRDRFVTETPAGLGSFRTF